MRSIDRDIKGFAAYAARLQGALADGPWEAVSRLGDALAAAWREDRQVFLCGNGGSAANAIHLANDFIYGVNRKTSRGLRVQALSANSSVLTCLANDEGYDSIFAQQLAVLANRNDILIALSGSGNSPNILRALEVAGPMGLQSFAILGYSGGEAKKLAQDPIHFEVDDMQVLEDLQLIVGHMIMQWLCREPVDKPAIWKRP